MTISYEEAKKWLENHVHRYFDQRSSPDEFNILKNFFKQHPKYKDWKLQNCVAFKITRSPKKKYIQTHVKVCKSQSDPSKAKWRIVSWKSCVSQKITKKAPPLTQAMRDSIRPQIAFYNMNCCSFKKCDICGSENLNQLEVDHYPNRFADIKREFLETTNLKHPTKFNYDPRRGNYKFNNDKHSRTFKQEWDNFHFKKASYRLLCGDCNKKN